MLFTVCSFLSVYEAVCTLRRTCRALHDGVTAECLLQDRHQLTLNARSLPALVASQPSTRALIRRIRSLSLCSCRESGKDMHLHATRMPLHDLRCPVDASRFLLSSLSSLYACIGHRAKDSLLSLFLLLETIPDSLSSLRRLHLGAACRGQSDDFDVAELTFSSLTRLQGLTHCRISLMMSSVLTCSSLVSALSSLQSLTFLDLAGSVNACPQLLPQLCSDAATPLLLRLQTLVLPCRERDHRLDALYDAFLCRLSSLPTPGALQRFRGVCVWHRAAGLLSVFSLPHLTQLDLTGYVRRSELVHFAASFTSASAPLVSLKLPAVWSEADADDRDRDEADIAEDAAALSQAARLLLSRFPALRKLHCDIGVLSGAVALPDSLTGDTTSGCSASLYRLVVVDRVRPSPFPFNAPQSFPQLTELTLDLPLKDAELELLLSGCPQLLVLSCTVWQSWQAVLLAARCCPRLLDLAVLLRYSDEEERDGDEDDEQQAGETAFTEAVPGIGGLFLPELISFRLSAADKPDQPSFGLTALLRLLTAPPHAQLQRVALIDTGLTAEQLLSLACLPRLSHLHAGSHRGIAQADEARRRSHPQLNRGPAGWADMDRHWPSARREDCEGGVGEARQLLGPHQQLQMRERVQTEIAEQHMYDNLLDSEPGVPQATTRAVFFAELRSAIAAAAP